MSNNNKNIELHFITNSESVYLWEHEMIQAILSLSGVSEVSFLVLDDVTTSSSIPPLVTLAYALDKPLASCQTESQSIKSIRTFAGSRIKKISPDNLSDTTFLESNFESKTTNYQIIVNLTESLLPDPIYSLVNTHVLSMFFSRLMVIKSELIGLLEFTDKRKVINTGIQLETESSEKNVVIYEAEHSLESASLCRTLETILHKTSLFMPHVLDKFSHYYEDSLTKTNYLDVESSLSKTLSFKEQLRFFTKFSTRVISRFWYKLTAGEQWIMMLAKNDEASKPNFAFEHFHRIMPPKSEFWADPFLFEHENKHFLFFEVFPFKRDLGHLSCMEINEDGTFGEVVKILERPYHFSYPNVFEFEDKVFMVPETGGCERIELYEAKSFPYEWELKHHLMEGIRAYDSTFIEHNGIWWMFANVAETEKCATNEELHLFYSDSPISQNWKPHPANPINTFASSSRPAGKIYKEDGKLFRPSQDCAGSYGAAINICEIVTLNKDTYEEKIISKRKPDWDKSLIGLHTLNFDSKYSVIDVILDRGFLK